MRQQYLISPFRKLFDEINWGSPGWGSSLSARPVVKRILPYGLAVGSTGLALTLMLVIGHGFEKSPHLIYYLAVLVTAWFAGWKPGLLATVLTAGCKAYFNVPGRREGAVGPEDVISTLAYVGACLLTILLIQRSQNAVARRRQTEAELQALNRELELRVAQRTAAWKQANADLEAFAYSISHDLRTPLRAIDGYARILREDWTQQLGPQALQYFEHICANAGRMGQMISDLLTFSRLGQRHLSKTQIDMEALSKLVLHELLAMEPRERVINIVSSDLPAAWGDSAMLRQVLTNLCSNALKFTRRAPVARIEIGGLTGADETVYFVRDNGVGFDPAYAGKLFKVFQRLHKAEDFEGTGVGLSIVHRIIQRHGGRVWAEGKVGEGATLFFTLPLQGRSDTEPDASFLESRDS